MDVDVARDEKLAVVCDEFGEAALAVWVALLALRKRADADTDDRGRFAVLWRDLAHEAWLSGVGDVKPPARASAIVRALSAVDLIELEHFDLGGVVGIQGWDKYQRSAGSHARRARHEAKQAGARPRKSLDIRQGHKTETESKGLRAPAREGRPKVGRKVVSEQHLELATGILGAFNELAGSSFSLDAWVTPLVMRIREKPELTIEQHRTIMVAAFKRAWWQGRPQPSVVYGNARAFEGAIEDARKQHKAGTSTSFDDYIARQREKDAA